MVNTHYYLHLFDGHGRGRTDSLAPQVIDPVAGSVLEFWGAPVPALERNAVLTGRVSGACARITRVISPTKCVVESIPRAAPGLAFTQNSIGGGFGETIDLDNCQGTGAGYQVNNGGGYAGGATVIALDTGVGTMLVNDRLKFAGHATVYTIAVALGGGTVTISPALTNAVADNEAVTLRGGEVLLLPFAINQSFPSGNQFLAELHDSKVTARLDGAGLGDWPYWDRQAKICELVVLVSATGTFRKGDDISTSAGGRFTVQFAIDNGGGVWGLYITRKRGTVAAANVATNRTTTGSGTIASVAANGAVPTGIWAQYSPHPNTGGTIADDQFFEFIPQGNGGPGVGPDAKLMHLLTDYHAKATLADDQGVRMVPFCSWDVEGFSDGNLGGVVIQVVKCSGTFPLTGTLVIGQTVTGPNGWSATVHGWSNSLNYLYVRATNGATLGAGTLTLSGGATVTGTGAALGWAKGSTHWNNMVAEITAATTAFGALKNSAPIKWEGVIAQPFETEVNLHAAAFGCPLVATDQFQQGWSAWIADLRTLLGDQSVPVCVWKGNDLQHLSDVFIVPGVSVAWYQGTLQETLPAVISRLTLVRSTDTKMSDDVPNLYLRTSDYLDLGTQFFRHLQFGQITVGTGDGLEEVAVGIFVGQSQMTGYIPAAQMMAIDKDPELWSSSAFPGADTRDPNALVWNPITKQIEVRDIIVNGGNGSWGTTVGTCGPDEVVAQRMKRRFSSDAVQSTRFVSFKFTVPGSCLSSEVIDATACWDPSLSARVPTIASMTVSVLSGPARGRFTAAAGTFSSPYYLKTASIKVAGSALGTQGIGGNNSGQWVVQQIHDVAADGSWVEILGTFVAETRTFTITVGPPPIWPEFATQWVAFQRDCQRLGIIPRVQFIAFEQGESDLVRLDLYEAALRRFWAAIVALCAKRLKGSEPVAKCITLLHSRTPFLPLYSTSGTGTEDPLVQAAAADVRIAEMRTIQTTVAASIGNCVTVDPSDLSLEINQFGSFPRTSRQFNGVHHTALAMIAKGYRMDAKLATLGPSKGIPAHPAGEVAVEFGAAIDGGTGGGSGTDEVVTEGSTDGGTTDGPSTAQSATNILDALDAAILSGGDVAAYTVNGRTVQMRSLSELIAARKYFAAEKAKAQGLRRTRVRFLR